MDYVVSCLPIALLFVLILWFKMSGWKSALITLVAAIAVSLLYKGLATCDVVFWAIIVGVLKAVFPILLIIIAAIFSYNILISSKQIEVIKQQFVSLTDDKGTLVLLMVWGFGGLLEGMAGFGTAVAIPAAILIGLDFKPFFSAVVALLGNTVATGFAALGVPIITLCKEAARGGIVSIDVVSQVSSYTILQLAPMFFLIPFAILMLTNRSAWLKNIVLSLWVGGVSFIAQLACAIYLGVETPAIIGSIAAILALLVAVKIKGGEKSKSVVKFSIALRAWSVYIFILLIILVTGPLCPPLNTFLRSHCVSVINIPVIDATFSFGWISNAALMIFVGSVLGGLVQGVGLRKQLTVFCSTIVSLKYTGMTIIFLISLSSVMNYMGMISTLAIGLVAITGSLYPIFAPLIGGIGTFVTGSDTSSNILFAKLQVDVAANLGMTGDESNWLLAANSTGATGGKMLSPQSIAIATAACDIRGSDSTIMRAAIPYALVYMLLAGIMVYIGC